MSADEANQIAVAMLAGSPSPSQVERVSQTIRDAYGKVGPRLSGSKMAVGDPLRVGRFWCCVFFLDGRPGICFW